MVFPDIVKGIGGDSADIVSVGFDVINAVSVVRTDCVGLAVTAFYAGAPEKVLPWLPGRFGIWLIPVKRLPAKSRKLMM